MNIETLVRIVDAPLINQMLAASMTNAPVVDSVVAGPAQFPFLIDGASNNALFLMLDLTFNPGSNTRVPNQVVLKAGRNVANTAEREIRFFELLRESGATEDGIVTSYGAAWLAEHDMGLLLLENVDGNSVPYHGPVAAHQQQYLQAIRVLAHLHACWWNHPGLGVGDLAFQWNDAFLGQMMPVVTSGAARFNEAFPAQLSADERIVVERVLYKLPTLLSRQVKMAASRCVVHGDAALWNFVLPEDAGGPVYLLDFQLWGVGLPAWDVGYMITLLWPTDFRQVFEKEMVAAYLDELDALGVRYAADVFLRDLRVCTLGLIGLTLANYELGTWGADVTSERMGWLMAAYEEYGCSELIT